MGLLLSLPGAVATSDLAVDIANLRSHKGMVRVCLTADPANFPACIDDAKAVTRSIPASASGLHFDGLPPGGYAIAVIHDENGNKSSIPLPASPAKALVSRAIRPSPLARRAFPQPASP